MWSIVCTRSSKDGCLQVFTVCYMSRNTHVAIAPPALEHLLHHGRRGEGGRLRPGDGHGPGGGRGRAERPDARPASDPAHGPGRHQALHEPRAGERRQREPNLQMPPLLKEMWTLILHLIPLRSAPTALWKLVLSQSGHLLSGSDPVWAAVSVQDPDGESQGESANTWAHNHVLSLLWFVSPL